MSHKLDDDELGSDTAPWSQGVLSGYLYFTWLHMTCCHRVVAGSVYQATGRARPPTPSQLWLSRVHGLWQLQYRETNSEGCDVGSNSFGMHSPTQRGRGPAGRP